MNFLLLILLSWFQTNAQDFSLNDLGEKFLKSLQDTEAYAFTDLIDSSINLKNQAKILESFLNIKENVFSSYDIQKTKVFNVLKQDNFTYIIFNNLNKFIILRTKTAKNNLISDIITPLHNLKVVKQLSLGEKIYRKRCYACHGKEGKGSIGPNLIDNYWKFVNNENDLISVIKNGKKGTMIIAYKQYLKPEEIKAVATYIKTLQGKKVKFPKKPEGEKKDIKFTIF